MILRIGDIAPDFEADTTQGHISFHDWAKGSWVFFFSHPADFTPVCTTEMGRTAQLFQAFADRNVKPIGLSTDSVEEHLKWVEDVNDTQHTTVNFPIIADADLTVSIKYEMLHPNESSTETVRSVFIIDPDLKIRLTMTYPMSVGRNFDEIVRVIDALQANEKHKIATPADWLPGEKVIIPPSVSNETAKTQFPQGWEELRPYLRLTEIS
jgi:peroxiredoxin (alkyl hydroperoxide reductase subunit C)